MPEWRLTTSFVIGFVGSTEMIKIRVPWGAPELSLWSGKNSLNRFLHSLVWRAAGIPRSLINLASSQALGISVDPIVGATAHILAEISM